MSRSLGEFNFELDFDDNGRPRRPRRNPGFPRKRWKRYAQELEIYADELLERELAFFQSITDVLNGYK